MNNSTNKEIKLPNMYLMITGAPHEDVVSALLTIGGFEPRILSPTYWNDHGFAAGMFLKDKNGTYTLITGVPEIDEVLEKYKIFGKKIYADFELYTSPTTTCAPSRVCRSNDFKSGDYKVSGAPSDTRRLQPGEHPSPLFSAGQQYKNDDIWNLLWKIYTCKKSGRLYAERGKKKFVLMNKIERDIEAIYVDGTESLLVVIDLINKKLQSK